MQKITPFLWFDDNAEEAVNFYVSIFKDAKITSTMRCGEEGPGPVGSVLVMNFEIEGHSFIALNGGPHYTFTPAVSFLIQCETQEEIDDLWAKLTDGGEEVQCGWLKDKFGLSWQIVPSNFGQWINGPDPEGSSRAMKAMMQMVKLDIAALKAAYEGV